jgi:hypothetical protein
MWKLKENKFHRTEKHTAQQTEENSGKLQFSTGFYTHDER